MGIDKLSLEYILKHGSQEQIDALKSFGESGYNAEIDKLTQEFDPSKFEGSFDEFCKTELGQILNGKELDAAFKIIDADGDGIISAEEAKNLSEIGDDVSDGKIDNSDIKAIFDAGKEYSIQNSAQEAVTPETTTETHEDGSKTVTQIKEDGTKVVTDYDNNGKKTKSVTTKTNGDETTREYEYNEGKLVSYKTETKDKDGNTVSKSSTKIDWNSDGTKTLTTEDADGTKTVSEYNRDNKKISSTVTKSDGSEKTTKYDYVDGKLSLATVTETDVQGNITKTSEVNYVDGKKSGSVVKDGNGNILQETIYNYNAKGELTSAQTSKSNGETITTEYDTKTGNKKSNTTVNGNNQVVSKTTYDDRTGKRLSTTSYEYNVDGSRDTTTSYVYDADGNVKSRDVFDKDGNKVTTSTYYRNSDGSMLRTDRNPETGEIQNTKLFTYNADGKKESTVTKDANGNTTETQQYEYYPSGIIKKEVNKAYNNEGTSILTEKSYDEKGNVISVTKGMSVEDTPVISETDNIVVEDIISQEAISGVLLETIDENPENIQGTVSQNTPAEQALTDFKQNLQELIQNTYVYLSTVQQMNKFKEDLNKILKNYAATEGISERDLLNAENEVKKIELTEIILTKYREYISYENFADLLEKNGASPEEIEKALNAAKVNNKEFSDALKEYNDRFGRFNYSVSENDEINLLNENYRNKINAMVGKYMTEGKTLSEHEMNEYQQKMKAIYEEYLSELNKTAQGAELIYNRHKANEELSIAQNTIMFEIVKNQIDSLNRHFAKIENPTTSQTEQYKKELQVLTSQYDSLQKVISASERLNNI